MYEIYYLEHQVKYNVGGSMKIVQKAERGSDKKGRCFGKLS